MKKKFSVIGTIIYLTCLLLPMFQPVLTAVAEDKQPQLFTVSHNGAEIKADQETEASDNNIIQIQATGNFTLKIPQSESYEIGLLTEEEQQELKNNAKETDKLSFDITAGESDYQLQLEKGMKAYFKVNLLAEAALLEGTASFEDVNLPETKVGVIHLVQPAQPAQPEPEVIEGQEEQPPASTEEQEEVQEEPEEQNKETKEVVFYKDGEKLDEKTTLTAEEGKKFNPVEKVTAKSPDGTEEYQVKAEVEENGKKLKLKDEAFVPKTEKNYLIQYSAIEEGQDEPITTLGVGLRAGNGSVNVSLEWVTGNAAYQYNQDYTVGQTGNGVTGVPYRLSISTTGKTYNPGELELRLPASQFKFTDSTGVGGAIGWHTNHISMVPYNQVTNQIFGYEIDADGETLIIKNKNKISGTIQESFEISTVLNAYTRKPTGSIYRVKGRYIIDGTNAKLKFDILDKTQTDPAKKNFSTNEIKLTLKTEFARSVTRKWSETLDPYNDWDTKLYGNRPADFAKYNWIAYRIDQDDNAANGKRLQIRYEDKIYKQTGGAINANAPKKQLTTAEINKLKIYTNYEYPDESYKNFYLEQNGGLDDKTINSNTIKWTATQNRDCRSFKDFSLPLAHYYRFLVGYPKSDYTTDDRICNEITGNAYDADKPGTHYNSYTSEVNTTIKEYKFRYPPGDITASDKFMRSGGENGGLNPVISADGSFVQRELAVNLLKSQTEVVLHTAGLHYSVNHGTVYTNPFALTMYDDHTTWKTQNSATVRMTHEDFYFKRLNIRSETLMPNLATQYNQPDGVQLPYLRLEYQDDASGVWKKHPTLIEPNIYKNRGVNPDGSKYDIYTWGTLNNKDEQQFRTIEMDKLGIKPYRFRLVTVDKNGNKAGVLGKVKTRVNADMAFYGVNPNDGKETQLEKWIKAGSDTSSLQVFNFTGHVVEAKNASNNWYVLNDDNRSDIKSDLNEFGFYLERRTDNVFLRSTAPKTAMKKEATQKNNVLEKCNDVTWTVDWAEGYDTSQGDSVVRDLINKGLMEIPSREKIVLYDLMPLGHTFEGINNLTYRDQTLNNTQYTSTVVSNNYNNSGRQLIQITIDGKKITNKSGVMIYREGGVQRRLRGNNVKMEYKTRVSWADRWVANENFSSSNRNSVTVSLFDANNKAQEMMSDGKTRTEINNEVKTGLNNSSLGYVPIVGTGNANIKNSQQTYGAIEITGETSVSAGLHKYVKGNRDTSRFDTSDYGIHTKDGTYQYRLDYIADASAGAGNYVKDVMIFDKLERVTQNSQGYTQGWKGTLTSVDVSHARSLGIDAQVYVSLQSTKQPFKKGTGAFTDSGWIKLENLPASDYKNVQIIGIDFSKRIGSGGDYIFDQAQYTNVLINMKMPDEFPTKAKAYNVPWLAASKYTSGSPNTDLTEGTYTDFELIRNPNLTIVKKELGNPSAPAHALWGVVFELEYPDGTKKEHTVDHLGKIDLTNLEPGKYKLRETQAKNGFELLAETYEFTVNQDRTITHPKDSTYWKYNYKDNTITLTVNNRRKFTLPITGGTGATISLLAIAAIGIIVAIAWYLKKYRFTA